MSNFKIIKKSDVINSNVSSNRLSLYQNYEDQDIIDVYDELTNASGNTWHNVYSLAASSEVGEIVKANKLRRINIDTDKDDYDFLSEVKTKGKSKKFKTK